MSARVLEMATARKTGLIGVKRNQRLGTLRPTLALAKGGTKVEEKRFRFSTKPGATGIVSEGCLSDICSLGERRDHHFLVRGANKGTHGPEP